MVQEGGSGEIKARDSFQREPFSGVSETQADHPPKIDMDVENPNDKEIKTNEGIDRRDLIIAGFAYVMGAMAGNEVGNLLRDRMEEEAVDRGTAALTEKEVSYADSVAKALGEKLKEYEQRLVTSGVSQAEAHQKTKDIVLRALDTLNKQEIVPPIVPRSGASIIEPHEFN